MSRRRIALVSVIAVLTGLTVGVFGFYMWDISTFYQKEIAKGKKEMQNSLPKDESSGENSNTKKGSPVETGVYEDALKKELNEMYPGAEHIEKGQVEWHDPIDLGDLGWTSKEMYSGFFGMKDMKNLSDGKVNTFVSNGIKYVEVGLVVQGKYAGSKVIVFFTSAGFDMPRNSVMYYALVGTTEKRILLGMEGSDWRENTKSELSAYIKGVVYDDYGVIDEVVMYPKEIQGKTDREVFQREEYAREFFFTGEKATRIFSDTVFGQAWMGEKEVKYPATEQDVLANKLNAFVGYDESKKPVLIQGDNVVEGGIYMRRPDGTAVVYRQKFDIFDTFDRVGVLQATWNDGKVNADQFEEYPSGCGIVSYVYDVTDTVNLDTDAVAVGKTRQGDVLYGFKDTTHPEFQKLYKEIYWVEAGQKKMSPEEFLKEYPEVFWKNAYGRTLAFYNTKFISPAECGKPVIYLYPEKTTDVSVKVSPSGFTKTDPEYGDGWKVSAEPNGTLTNKADGKVYPYLFWEGYSNTFLQKSERGFVVAQENLKAFLDEKLAAQGLIQKEIADFEEFWLPKMQEENKPYYFVTFLPKFQIDALAPLRIDPKPDTVIRVMMDYRGLDSRESVTPQNLFAPERRGFVAVEWGGMLRK